MSKMKSLVGRKSTKEVKFCEETLTINKLSVGQVIEIQKSATGENAKTGIEIMHLVIKLGCPDAAEMTEEDFNSFSMDELTNLSNEIMEFSGVSENQGK